MKSQDIVAKLDLTPTRLVDLIVEDIVTGQYESTGYGTTKIRQDAERVFYLTQVALIDAGWIVDGKYSNECVAAVLTRIKDLELPLTDRAKYLLHWLVKVRQTDEAYHKVGEIMEEATDNIRRDSSQQN